MIKLLSFPYASNEIVELSYDDRNFTQKIIEGVLNTPRLIAGALTFNLSSVAEEIEKEVPRKTIKFCGKTIIAEFKIQSDTPLTLGSKFELSEYEEIPELKEVVTKTTAVEINGNWVLEEKKKKFFGVMPVAELSSDDIGGHTYKCVVDYYN